MLRLCKDGEFIDVVLNGRRIASWKNDQGVCPFLTQDAISITNEVGETEAIILPLDEYEYFRDVEEMLVAMKEMLRERTE